MVTYVVAHVELLDLSVRRGKLVIHFLIEFVKLLLLLSGTTPTSYNHLWSHGRTGTHRGHLRIVIHLLNQNRLTECRSVVLSRATISVSARSNLEKEGTIHSTNETRKRTLTCPPLFHTHVLNDQPFKTRFNERINERKLIAQLRTPLGRSDNRGSRIETGEQWISSRIFSAHTRWQSANNRVYS